MGKQICFKCGSEFRASGIRAMCFECRPMYARIDRTTGNVTTGIKIGDRFGRWEAIKEIPSEREFCLCKCECGTVKEVRIISLRNGHSKSCGCGRRREKTNVLVQFIKDHPEMTLDEIGKRFGVSKQHVSQVGIGYIGDEFRASRSKFGKPIRFKEQT